jgi:DNA replication protein DnaC
MTVGPCKLCGKMVEIPDEITVHQWMRIVMEAKPEDRGYVQDFINRKIVEHAPHVLHDSCVAAFHEAAAKKQRVSARFERAAKWAKFTPFPDTDLQRIRFGAKNEAINAFAEAGVSVVLVGETRRGKTRLGFLMVEPHYLAGRTIRCFTHIGLKNTLLKKSSEGPSWMTLFIDQLKSCDVLFLDDLGKATMTDADGRGLQIEEQFFDVMDHRLIHNKKTLMTMNDINKTLIARMSKDRGAPFAARIAELARVFAG